MKNIFAVFFVFFILPLSAWAGALILLNHVHLPKLFELSYMIWKDPNDISALNNRAILTSNMLGSSTNWAKSDLKRVIAIEPENANSLWRLGRLYRHEDREKALIYYQRALDSYCQQESKYYSENGCDDTALEITYLKQ